MDEAKPYSSWAAEGDRASPYTGWKNTTQTASLKKKKTTTLPYNSSMEKKRQEGMRWFRVIYTAEYFKKQKCFFKQNHAPHQDEAKPIRSVSVYSCLFYF